jgi:hypothetical protein
MATNITWHDGSVSLEERQGLLKQKVKKKRVHNLEFVTSKIDGWMAL